MPRKKKEIEGVESLFLYELFAMDIELLKEHVFAVNEAILYHEQKASDASRYKYRIDHLLKVRNWLDVEDTELKK
jgi:hypothetical protein|tara:strand:- start:2404 stop:2628 length:225 start_codon:yes stop_codon:yes gene_type:complete